MHTRLSRKTSPLIFDPEIEKTARKIRALHQSGVKVSASSSSNLHPTTIGMAGSGNPDTNNQHPPQDDIVPPFPQLFQDPPNQGPQQPPLPNQPPPPVPGGGNFHPPRQP
jgi:hypothetical protein